MFLNNQNEERQDIKIGFTNRLVGVPRIRTDVEVERSIYACLLHCRKLLSLLQEKKMRENRELQKTDITYK